MKRFAVLSLAALLVLAFTLPAAALETQFGGYWRTRFMTNQNFTGEDETEAMDLTIVDTRTRLYFTAIFHENLKFVNKFEFDGTWGSDSWSRAAAAAGNKGFAKITADGANIEIKNSYADFNVGPLNAKVGVQGVYLARGFIADTDAPAFVLTYKSDMFALPFIWVKAHEGMAGNNALDVDLFSVAPVFTAGGMTINPYVLYVFSDNASGYGVKYIENGFDDVNMYYAGLDLDMSFDPISIWFTGIYQGGEADLAADPDTSVDFSAWLAALGFKVGMGFGDVHGQVFWATGPDRDDPDPDEVEQFFIPGGGSYLQSYYWAEIMGYGLFDRQFPAADGGPLGDEISDIQAANLGVTINPMPKLSVRLDAWYARRDDDIDISVDTGRDDDVVQSNLEDAELGTEIDLRLTYQIIDGLNIDLVGAYLFAGDVITQGSDDEADPYEIGSRLSLSF